MEVRKKKHFDQLQTPYQPLLELHLWSSQLRAYGSVQQETGPLSRDNRNYTEGGRFKPFEKYAQV